MALERHGFPVAGGLKGFYQRKPHTFPISTLVGSSAGAFVGALAASGMFIKEWMRGQTHNTPNFPRFSWKDLCYAKKKGGGGHWPTTAPNVMSVAFRTVQQLFQQRSHIQGFFSSWGMASYLKKHFLPTDCFDELNCELFMVGSDVRENHGFVFGPKNNFGPMNRVSFSSKVSISDAIACSTALPVMFEPFRIHDANHRWEVMDGEIFFACPFEVALAANADIVIISQIYRPFEIAAHPKEKIKADEIAILSLYSLIYNSFLARLNAHAKKRHPFVITIQPDPSDLSFFRTGHFSLSPEQTNLAARTGYHATLKMLKQIKRTVASLCVATP